MNSITYCVRSETYLADGTSRSSYGIALTITEDGILSVLDSVADISAEIEPIQQLAALCNRLSLSPIHFHDVVEDFINA